MPKKLDGKVKAKKKSRAQKDEDDDDEDGCDPLDGNVKFYHSKLK